MHRLLLLVCLAYGMLMGALGALVGQGAACPLLSVIATGRNDDYGGGNFAVRAQRWLTQFGDLAVLSGACPALWFEVLLVEWNPGATTAPFVDILVPPPCVAATILSVPAQVHDEQLHRSKSGDARHQNISFLEYHAKNAALRRISKCARFVLLTNPDALLSRELLRWLSEAAFSPHHFVRARRVDITAPIPPLATGDALFEFLGHHVAWPSQRSASPTLSEDVNLMSKLDMEASGDFVLAPAAALISIRGGVEVREREDSHGARVSLRLDTCM